MTDTIYNRMSISYTCPKTKIYHTVEFKEHDINIYPYDDIYEGFDMDCSIDKCPSCKDNHTVKLR